MKRVISLIISILALHSLSIFATDHQMKQTKQYNNIANTYSDIFAGHNQLSNAAYFAQFDSPLEGLKLIDLGCGDGHDLAIFHTRDAFLYGLDSSEEMVKLAQKKNPEAEIKLGLFEAIPYADNSFDMVVSKWAFQTSPEIEPIYKEVNRVLKPGGTFIFLTGHPTRQFIEKKKHPKDYFKQEMVESVLFDGSLVVHEPTHTMNEYLSPYFFENFELLAYEEGFDAGAEKINGDTYPIYALFKARKRLSEPS